MSLFDSIISETDEKFGLNNKAGSLLSALLALITDKSRGGFSGFLDTFNTAGLSDSVSSWVGTEVNEPLSDEQLTSALGEDTLGEIAAQADVDKPTANSALAFMVPKVVDTLTPNGVVPDETDLLSSIGNYISGFGGAVLGATGAAASGVFDRIGTAAVADESPAGDGVTGIAAPNQPAAFAEVNNEEPASQSSILSWLLPLILLALVVILGITFCRKSTVTIPPATNTANTNANRTTATNTTKTVDSSFRLEAKDGKYVAAGIVKDEATKKQVMDALNAEFGAGNVNFDGLKVDAAAKDFGPGWWANFNKMLPGLKDWKTGVLSFTGATITEASGLPPASLDQLKSLFTTGWTLPASVTGAASNAERKLTEVSLPDGTKLQAYPGGIEDQLIKFIESDEYKNGTADTLKDKWFSFDDLNFKFGTTELVPESKRQLDNIVAILKAFPDAKIKIGGYTDKKGDDAANKKLSGDRAKAVKSALEKAGVGAQVPEAEGYGEEFAKVPETASDKEREADRKTSVRLIK